MNLIIAGSYEQYLQYRERNGHNPEFYRYVASEKDIWSYHKNTQIICIGTFDQHYWAQWLGENGYFNVKVIGEWQ